MKGRREGSPGVTLKDVAQRAGVHPATASRALDPERNRVVNADTRARVVAAAEELDYRVNSFARSLRKNSSGMVGIIVADVANPFLSPMLRGIEQIVSSEKLLLIAETHDDSATLREIVEHFISRRVDAVILSAAHLDDEGTVALLATHAPVVLAVRSAGTGRWPTVTHDDVLGGQLAARHLVELGHTRLAQLRGPANVSSFSGRAQGFASVLAATHARDVAPSMDPAREPTVAEGRRLAGQALDQDLRPTAIFAHNDLMAVGAVEAARHRGLRCPDDLSVVGYNDAPMSDHVDPPLTTIRLPGVELGRRAATIVLEALRGGRPAAETIRLPPERVVRASSSAPPRVPSADLT
jgi:LacI family transcriptional regulator